MPSSTVEDYIKRLYLEQQRAPGRLVPMGRLAAVMAVVPGTATTMIKALAESGLVAYAPRAGVRLSRGGEKLALLMLRRHRLVELFLVQVLGLDWSEVHEEAEELEHAISDKVLDRIDALLGHPDADPHGDPIPTSAGRVPAARLRSLLDCPSGRRLRIARVADQSAAFLRFVERGGLRPGAAVTVESRDPAADAVALLLANNRRLNLGSAAAAKILVAAAP